ncbi:ABC transporter permease [Dethiosulfatarculus sandiegensis]|uniref:Glutathione transport system permease protein GsiC n=1 Tax=Dethiosulfatarculus sandiegensis TaxID=1429043 RepID=A0A0D2G7B7_9BACT|nr:ABC transporter permease [Dethiosulfatarculus sandiegensis]KIX10867.1 ABC transporter permease [Dethiosulfatarculus sandiegensis]
MLAYACRRLIQFVPTLLAISLIMFLLLNVLPGNAALMAAGDQDRNVDTHYIEQMKKDWGLDKPLWERYVIYLKDLATGDLGLSFLRRESVGDLIAQRLWPTLKLALVAMTVAILLGVPLGFYSAMKRGRLADTFTMMGAVSGVSMPQFWLGLLLMYLLAVKFPILPPQGYGDGDFVNVIMPGFTLGVGYMALLARTTRAAVVEILTTDYIRTARAKGLSEVLINRKHVMRNALILVLTTAGLQFGALMAQTVIVEKLFSWPGLGSLLVDSIFQRDIPITQGCILTIILIFLTVNLIVDLLYGLIDPRIRVSYK